MFAIQSVWQFLASRKTLTLLQCSNTLTHLALYYVHGDYMHLALAIYDHLPVSRQKQISNLNPVASIFSYAYTFFSA